MNNEQTRRPVPLRRTPKMNLHTPSYIATAGTLSGPRHEILLRVSVTAWPCRCSRALARPGVRLASCLPAASRTRITVSRGRLEHIVRPHPLSGRIAQRSPQQDLFQRPRRHLYVSVQHGNASRPLQPGWEPWCDPVRPLGHVLGTASGAHNCSSTSIEARRDRFSSAQQ